MVPAFGAVPAGYFAAFNANVCYGTGVIAEKPDIVPDRRYLHVGQDVAVAAEFPAERHGFSAYRGERSSRKLDISGKDVISAPLRIVTREVKQLLLGAYFGVGVPVGGGFRAEVVVFNPCYFLLRSGGDRVGAENCFLSAVNIFPDVSLRPAFRPERFYYLISRDAAG